MQAKTARKTVWGNWEFDPELLVLRFKEYQYEVDLERMPSSVAILDWIFQVNQYVEGMMTKEDMADFIEALHSLITPQANYCSSGMCGGKERMDKVSYARLMQSLKE